MWKKVACSVAVLVLAGACAVEVTSSSPTAPPTSGAAADTPTARPGATAPPTGTGTGSTSAAGTATRPPLQNTGTPGPTATQTALQLSISEPQDEAVVSVSFVTVRGKTAPGAEVSVNGELAEVDANGNFSIRVMLEEGANLLTITASDEDGNEASVELTVGYAR